MTKTILLTGATDGIGLVTAEMLLSQGHKALLHGRNPNKLQQVEQQLKRRHPDAQIEIYLADLSDLKQVVAMADTIAAQHEHLDVLINNAGVYQLANPISPEGQDYRFIVNTLAPYLLTQKLLPLMNAASRVVNLSSAAQAPVSLEALQGKRPLSDNAAYAQSKLAITMWTRALSQQVAPMLVAVNPKSFLGSKMVKEAYGVVGGDLSIGADILIRAALSEEFADASGKYFDNDSGNFAPPHPDALDSHKCAALMATIESLLKDR